MFKTFAFEMPGGWSDWCATGRGRGGWGWGWSGFDGFGSDWGPRRQQRGRMGRMFEQGDLKYVILRLLEEKPRHGYEIIKELEDRFGGAYSPSPGTVYPTLTMLEDLGYAKAREEDAGRKIYEITPEGAAYLKEHSTTVDSIFISSVLDQDATFWIDALAWNPDGSLVALPEPSAVLLLACASASLLRRRR